MTKRMIMIENRDLRLDVIRDIAIINVISVHFLLNSGIYELPLEGKRMFVMMFARTLFLTCVPLFIMLTGYLTKHKTNIALKYFVGIWKILRIYLISSIFCILFKIFYLKEVVTLRGILGSILNFSANPYAWYVNMYIGLFLITPFLNVLWGGLKIEGKKSLLFVCAFLTVFPSFNIWHTIFPTWWYGVYPITYYFAGAYLSEINFEIKKSKIGIMIVVCALLFTLLNFYHGYKNPFIEETFTSYGGFECTIIAVLIFLFVLNVNLNNIPHILKNLIVRVSQLSFGMYLSSWIVDVVIYKILNTMIASTYEKVIYAPLVIICVVIGSAILSYGLSLLDGFLCWFMGLIYKRRKDCG